MPDGLDGIQVQDSGGTSVHQWMGGIARLRMGTGLTAVILPGGIIEIDSSGGPGAGLPTGSGNKVVATPADGSSAVSALRILVENDIPALASSKVGLGNVDNTADSAKPVSTAQQTALDAKLGLHAKADTAGAADNAVTLATGTDRTKLDGIAAGATVGADWDTNVAHKPTLGTAAVKNIPASGDAAATEVVYGSDTRLTNARTPVAHSHAPGDVTGTAVVTADSRLSDARTPLAHSHAPADVTGTAVVTADARLSDARTPLAHNQAESTITFSDVTTGDVSTTAHGFVPKVTDTTKFLKGDGTWATVTASTPDVVLTSRAPTGDVTITAGYGAIAVSDYEIASGFLLDIQSNGVFAIL